VEEICGGHMVFAGLGSPIGRATGAGLDRPFTVEDLDRVEQFYAAHGAPAQVRQGTVGEIDVVLDEIALRQAGPREEDLVRVRYGDVMAANPHGLKYRRVRVASVRRDRWRNSGKRKDNSQSQDGNRREMHSLLSQDHERTDHSVLRVVSDGRAATGGPEEPERSDP